MTDTLVLGGLGLLVLVKAEALAPAPWVGPAMALSGVALQLLALPFYVAGLGGATAGTAGQKSLALLMGQYQHCLWAHLVLAAITAVLLGVVWQRKALTPRLLYVAFALGLAGEVAARVLFYAIGVPISVG